MNGIVEKAIVDWLSDASERAYQAAFSDRLILEGHSIRYTSAHGQGELGRDIISIKGQEPYAFQLKGEPLSHATWRKYEGEFRELWQLPIPQQYVAGSRRHVAVVATNQTVTEDVRNLEREYTDRLKRGGDPAKRLEIWDGNRLRSMFLSNYSLLPDSRISMRDFLKLYLSPGTALFPKTEFHKFLESIEPASKLTGTEAARYCSTRVLLTTLALRPFSDRGNSFAEFEAWVLLGARLLHRASVDSSCRVAMQERWPMLEAAIAGAGNALIERVFEEDSYLEGDTLTDGGDIYWTRASLVLGACAALLLWKGEIASTTGLKFCARLKRDGQHLNWWGDGALPSFVNCVHFLLASGLSFEADTLLETALARLLTASEELPHGSALPHISAEQALSYKYGFGAIVSGNTMPLVSRGLLPLIDLIVRRGDKLALAKQWKRVVKVAAEHFSLARIRDLWLWHSERGANWTLHYNRVQSWAELEKDCRNIPNRLRKLTELERKFLRLWIAVAPHRCTSGVVRMLERNLPSAQ